MNEGRNVVAWKVIVRQWIKDLPSGTIFRSKDIFAWVANGGVELGPGDLKAINKAGRAIWRHRLSRALSELHHSRELAHPAVSRQAWRVP